MARPFLARFALTLALLWLAAGALYKLFEGSPNDLPTTVKELSPLGALDTLRAAIAIELAVVGLVVALPRVGWVFLAGTFGVFLGVLAPMALAGEASCGCFGGNIDVDPRVMMAVDGGLLLFLLLTRPWRTLPAGSGLGAAAFLPFAAVAVLAPYGKIQDVELKVAPRASGPGAGATAPAPAEGTPAEGTPAEVAPVAGTSGGGSGAAADGTPPGDPGAPAAEVPAADPLAALGLPEFYELRVTDMVGQDPWTTAFGSFYEYGLQAGYEQLGAFQPNQHVIVYRQTCEHCEEHLKEVWQKQQSGEWAGHPILLVRLVETKDTPENDLCTVLPEPSEKITFPPLKRGYGITTPYSFDLDENGLIANPKNEREDG